MHTKYINFITKGTIPNAQRTAVIAAAELATYDSIKHYLLNKFFLDDSFYVHFL
jgi:hypothetical protein